MSDAHDSAGDLSEFESTDLLNADISEDEYLDHPSEYVDGDDDSLSDLPDLDELIDTEDDSPCSATRWHSYPATSLPMTIPDNDETGVSSSISVDDCSLILEDIQVSIDISHSFIGDLVVVLHTPSGEDLILHDRSGTITDDIVTIYPTITLPATSICKLFPLNSIGEWVLSVSDRGSGDVGTLNAWQLYISGERHYCPYYRYESSDSLPVAIPDWDTVGVDSSITVTDTGPISGLDILVDVQHEWIGDIRVEIEPPGSGPYILYDRSGGTSTHLTTIFPQETTPVDSLGGIVGTERNGTWILHVYDLDPTLTGSLNNWFLYIH